MKLSILVPARNEEFLVPTIEDVLRNSSQDTEVLVALDNWEIEKPVLPTNKRLKVIETRAGQRGATNILARFAKAPYLMKLDAHCSLSKGFDTAILEDVKEDRVLVPALHNLHAYDWLCENKHRHFQGKYEKCEQCGSTNLRKETVWKIIPKPSMVSYYFDTDFHFQYSEKQAEGMLVETMSIQGSCFIAPKSMYWELKLCDETFGSWGQQGIEVAVKTWLSGGQVMSTRKAFYGHQFRETEGFPYLNPVEKILETRQFSKDFFFKSKFDGQIHPISWLIEKFGYEGDWTKEAVDNLIDS